MLLAAVIMGVVILIGLIISLVMTLTDKECREYKPTPPAYSKYWQTIYAVARKADTKSTIK